MKRLPVLFSLLIIASFILAACVPVPPAPPPVQPPPTAQPVSAVKEAKFTILHTNDTHGHLDAFRIAEFPDPVGGVARRATLVNQIRKETPNVLLVDGGDVHQGILMADTFKGEPDIQFMNTMKYDVMALGNHDVDYGWDIFQQRKAAAKFPIINANLVVTATGKPALTPFVIKEIAGIKVAFTSFSGTDHPSLVKQENIPGLQYTHPITAAKTLIPELRKQADLVIVLGHELLNDDRALATQVPGIDIIIGAHEHARIDQPMKIGDTLMVEDWQFGAFLGRLDLTVRDGKIVDTKYQLIPVANSIQPDPAMDAEVKALVAKLKQARPERFEVLGEAMVDITDKDLRTKEAAIGNFAADVMRDAAKADIAVSTASSFLSSIFKGPITLNDLMEAMPYKNNLVTAQLTGEQVKKLLEVSAQNVGKGTFSQVSGVSFTITGDKVADITVGGAPLDEKKLYLVATTNYQGGVAAGYKDVFKAGQNYTDTGKDVNQLAIDYIKAKKQVSAKVEGRITVK